MTLLALFISEITNSKVFNGSGGTNVQNAALFYFLLVFIQTILKFD